MGRATSSLVPVEVDGEPRFAVIRSNASFVDGAIVGPSWVPSSCFTLFFANWNLG